MVVHCSAPRQACDPRAQAGHTALMKAAGYGHHVVVQLLVQAGAEVNAQCAVRQRRVGEAHAFRLTPATPATPVTAPMTRRMA